MPKFLIWGKNKIVRFWQTADQVARHKAVDAIEYELDELNNIFAILILGTFIGVPSPPIHVTMAMMPEMVEEFEIMFERVQTAHDPLGDLFSIFGIE